LLELDGHQDPASFMARLAAIVDSSFDAIISKDLNSVITSWNPAAETLFGYTAEEAVGRSIVMLIPADRRSEENEIIAKVRAGERVDTYETLRMRKDGRLVHVSLTVSPIRDGSGKIIGASKIARDVSEAKETARRIKLLLREVNHRVKNQYAVILSIIRETGRFSASIGDFEQNLRQRIMAMSSAHDLLVTADWRGAEIADLVTEQLRPFDHDGNVIIGGPLLKLAPNAVQNLGMAFHELATNSSKYGVLNQERGEISIQWHVSKTDEFGISWTERREEPASDYPTSDTSEKVGYGTIVLKMIAPRALFGTAEFAASAEGVQWSLRAPAEHVVESHP
jgi:PAS domain S-box-containing protein